MIKSEVFNRLYEPFEEKDIEWRVQRGGVKDNKPWAMVLAYVTARAAQDRLDEVFGSLGWKMEYTIGSKGVLCHLGAKDESGEWVTKTDGAPETDIESFKGGISNAFKRTASAGFGIGRYLYKLKKNYAIFDNGGMYSAKIDDGNTKKWFKWNPPTLPGWALPNNTNDKPDDKPGENPDDQPLDQERVETLTTYINHLGEEKSAAFYVWLKKEYGATVVDNVKQGEYLNVYEALKKVYDSSKAK